ncbi:MAG: GTP cyclohydrolase IIa [Desulfitobacteriaceae bacterium]
MLSKVAIVGPPDLVNEMISVGKDFPEIELVGLAYEKETEALDLVKANMQRIDVVSFTGPVPYFLTKGKIPDYIPLVYVRYSGAALYRTLFQILAERGGDVQALRRLSIDTLSLEAVQESYFELGLDSSEVHVLGKELFLDSEAQIKEHLSYYQSGRITAALSCLTSSYRELLRQGVPAYRISPTRFDMRETLRLANIESLALYHRKAQVAVAILKVEQSAQNYVLNSQRTILELHQLLLDYGEKTGATISFVGGDEFIIFSTRGALQTATDNFREAPLLREIQQKVRIGTIFGLGIGHSAAEAESNARTALKQSRDAGWNNCFILQEDGVMIGPLSADIVQKYEIRSVDPALTARAAQCGLSVATLSRLLNLMENYGRNTLTANEISAGLNITLRSARRLLNTLKKVKLATVAGMEQPVGKGRPRQIFALWIKTEGGIG